MTKFQYIPLACDDFLGGAAQQHDPNKPTPPPPKWSLDLPTLITPESLEEDILLRADFYTNGDGVGVGCTRDPDSRVSKECEAVCKEIHAGTYRPRENFSVPPYGCLASANPIRHRVDWAVAMRVAARLNSLISSLMPNSVMPTGQAGVWAMLRAMMIATAYGWYYVWASRIQGVPDQILISDAISDIGDYLDNPTERRLVGSVLSGFDRVGSGRVLSATQPCVSPAVQLRLHHALRGVPCYDVEQQILTLRHDDVLVGFSADDVDLNLVNDAAGEAVFEAGLSLDTDANAVDLRDDSFEFRGFTLRFADGQLLVGLDSKAYDTLAERLGRCRASAYPTGAAEMVLTDWMYQYAPGWGNRHPVDSLEEKRQRIVDVIENLRFGEIITDSQLRQLLAEAAYHWHRFDPDRDPAALVHEAIKQAKLHSGETPVDAPQCVTALA